METNESNRYEKINETFRNDVMCDLYDLKLYFVQ